MSDRRSHCAEAHASGQNEKLARFVAEGERHKQILAAMVDGREVGEFGRDGAVSGKVAGLRRQRRKNELGVAIVEGDEPRGENVGADETVRLAGDGAVGYADEAVAKLQRADAKTIDMRGSGRVIGALLEAVEIGQSLADEQPGGCRIDNQFRLALRKVGFQTIAVDVLWISKRR